MIQFDARVEGLREFGAYLQGVQKQIPFAQAKALTDVSRLDIVPAQRKAMKNVFHRPIPFTLKAATSERATKRDPQARVFVRSRRNKRAAMTSFGYLGPQVFGGQRQDKASEVALRSAGLLPAGMQTVPGAAMPLDENGNVNGRFVRRIVRAALGRGKGRRRKRGLGKYIYGEVGGTKGIWMIDGQGWRPMLIFVRKPRYRARYDFAGVTQRAFDRFYERRFDAAWAYALRSAR